jgi:outer membrane lipoprotein carrier protein
VIRRFILVVCIYVFSHNLWASDPKALNELTALLKKMNSFQADFSQKIKSSTGEKISDTHGKVVIKRPDRFYWKSVKPDPILVVADGNTLWTYDMDLEQVTKQSQSRAIKDSPASLLSGSLDKFEQDYDVAYAKQGACKNSQGKCFVLKPKQKESTFKNIYIGFTVDKLVEIRMSDPLGQNINTLFSNVALNRQDIDVTLFQFKPPKNIDVIEYD